MCSAIQPSSRAMLEAMRRTSARPSTSPVTFDTSCLQAESIAWLLDIRGGDVPHTPLPLGFAFADDPRFHDTGTDQVPEGRVECDRQFFRGIDVVLANSSDMAAGLTKDLGLDPRKMRMVNNPIDIETIRRSVMRNAAWPAGMLLSPSLNGAPQALNQRLLPYDPAAAKKQGSWTLLGPEKEKALTLAHQGFHEVVPER